MRVGFVGWRGMVGSVLMQRMVEERDFDHIEPVFFSTSNAGGKAPAIGGATGALRDANDIDALSRRSTPIVTCQGGDWTNTMFPRLRAAGLGRLLDRRRVGAADAATTRSSSSTPSTAASSIARVAAGHAQLHRRQLHGQPDDDGARRAASSTT